MNYSISRTPEFSKHLKQIAKKYPSIKSDYPLLLNSLSANPIQGVALGKNCYKIRWKITSKHAGKSGGARVITYVELKTNILHYLMFMIKQTKHQYQKKSWLHSLKKPDRHV